MTMSPAHFAGAPHFVPGASGQHVPAVPGSAQLTQSPLQAVRQQTPSLQKPLAHSLSCLQGEPAMGAPHRPLTHRRAAQSASLVHLSWQRAVAGSHVYGAQTIEGPGRQDPLPSQDELPTTVTPSAEHAGGAPHAVPAPTG